MSGTVRGLLAVGVGELVVDLTHAWDSAVLLTVLARTRADLAEHGGRCGWTASRCPSSWPQ